MNAYPDASAVIKLYHREIGSERLLAFLQRNADDMILSIADITRTEFHSAFLRKVRTIEIALLQMPLLPCTAKSSASVCTSTSAVFNYQNNIYAHFDNFFQ